MKTPLFLSVLAVCVWVSVVIAEREEDSGLLMAGTPSETPWYAIDSGIEGPTFLLVGGMHGNEPAGAAAAERIRHWPIKRGRLVVIPRANQQALSANERRFPRLKGNAGDLNRHFPRSGQPDETQSELAAAIWSLAKETKPDWVVDLHEGFAVNRQNPDSVGSTILCKVDADTAPLFEEMLAAVNQSIARETQHFRLLGKSKTANGGLVRASIERLEAKGAILETTYKGFPLEVRVQQHEVMMQTLLVGLEMLDADDSK